MIEIVVYFDNSYKTNKSIFVTFGLTREEILNEIEKEFGKNWYSFDII